MSTASAAENQREEDLRRQLRRRLLAITKREPLKPTFRHIFENAAHNPSSYLRHHRSADTEKLLAKDPLYKDIRAQLRERVESFQLSGVSKNRGRERDDDAKWTSESAVAAMRAAFTLRECKEHEQKALVKTYIDTVQYGPKRPHGIANTPAFQQPLQPPPPVEQYPHKRKRLEAMAYRLQEKQQAKTSPSSVTHTSSSTSGVRGTTKPPSSTKGGPTSLASEATALKATSSKSAHSESIVERERKKLIEEQLKRERERERKEKELAAEVAARRLEENNRRRAVAEASGDSPVEAATHRLYEPIFRDLWDMEFSNLGGTNPFRIVIDASNCAAMGVPDYVDVVKKPMNLTFIKDKVEKKTYPSFQSFLDDVKLLINNALLYNSDPQNEYHIAAQKMKKRFKRHVKHVLRNTEASGITK